MVEPSDLDSVVSALILYCCEAQHAAQDSDTWRGMLLPYVPQ